MTSTFLPFLYQTRTLQRCARAPISLVFTHRAYATQLRPRRKTSIRADQSIPFEMNELDKEDDFLMTGDPDGGPGQQSTITPSEAEIFKGIFDEIAQGRMPQARKRPGLTPTEAKEETTEHAKKDEVISATEVPSHGPKSIVDQFRTPEFRDNFLEKYPVSLRKAAEMAMGKFEMEPQQRLKMVDMTELDEEEAAKHKAWARYLEVQEQEKQRVEVLMQACQSDVDLWRVMEEEVFSLPMRLGIVQQPLPSAKTKKTRRSKKAAAKATEDNPAEQPPSDSVGTQERVMDIHGPLYPHYLTTGLNLFDTAFPRPSPFAFKILPRVKELGLPSYVLGVTTPFYLKLAQMHWNHFGDAASTFDMLEEMSTLGLAADEETALFLQTIRDHLHGCTWGAQGSFVMAMMEAAPYDTALTQRLEAAEKYVRRSFAFQNRGGERV